MAQRIRINGVPGFDQAISFPGDMPEEEIRQAINSMRRDKFSSQLEDVRKKANGIDMTMRAIDEAAWATYGATPVGMMDSFNRISEGLRGVAQDSMRAAGPSALMGHLIRSQSLIQGVPGMPGAGVDMEKVQPVRAESTMAALSGQPLPEDDLNAVQLGLSDIAGSVPEITASMLYPPGAPYFFGGGAFVKTAEQMKNRPDLSTLEKANRIFLQSASGAVAPGLGKAGMDLAGKAMRRFIANGQTWATRAGAQRAVESLVANTGQQAVEFVANAPDFAEASPEEREEMAVRMLVGNFAFAIPELLSQGRTATQEGMSKGDALATNLSQFLDMVEPEASPLGGAYARERAAELGMSEGNFDASRMAQVEDPAAVAEVFGGMFRRAVQEPEFRKALRETVESYQKEGYVPPEPYQEIPPEAWMADDYDFGGSRPDEDVPLPEPLPEPVAQPEPVVRPEPVQESERVNESPESNSLSSRPPEGGEQKEFWQKTKAEADAEGWGEDWSAIIRRNIDYGKPVPANVLRDLEAYDAQREQAKADTGKGELEYQVAKPGDRIIRYTHKDGTGLLNNQGLDYSKLTDSEYSRLVELMDFGLQQPSSGVSGKFYFTEAGEKQHAKMIALLKKASKTGVVRKVETLQRAPDWQSTDGQIAVNESLSSRPPLAEDAPLANRPAEARGFGKPRKPDKVSQEWLWGQNTPPPGGPTQTKITIHGFDGRAYEVEPIQSIEFPEAWNLLNEIGMTVKVRERIIRRLPAGRGPFGMFMPKGSGEVLLAKALAENPDLALQTFLHEIGHAHEYFDYNRMANDRVSGFLNRIAQINDLMVRELPVWPGKHGGGKVTDADVMADMWNVSQFIRPLPKGAASDPAYMGYRMEAVEMYADFVSAMLMTPEKVRQIAPTSFEIWMNWMDSKPTFKRAYDEIQSMLRTGNPHKYRTRIGDLKEDFKLGRERIRGVNRARKKFALSKADDIWIKTDATHYIRQRVDQVEKARGGRLRANPVRELDQVFFQDAQIFSFVSDINEQIIKPIHAAGLDVDDLGAYLMLSRIAGDPAAWRRYKDMKMVASDADVAFLDSMARRVVRLEQLRNLAQTDPAFQKKADAYEKKILKALDQYDNAQGNKYTLDDVESWYYDAQTKGTRADIWNPRGYNPETAKATLNGMLYDMTPEQRQAIVTAARTFRRNVFDVVTEAHRVGLMSDQAFRIVQNNKDWYAAFRPIDKITRTYLSPMVKRASGTVAQIENPMYSTAFKVVPMLQAIAEQKAKLAVRDFFGQHFPDEFRKPKGPDAITEAKVQGLQELTIYEGGVAKSYYVSEGVSKAFEFMSAADVHFGVTFLSKLFRSTVYPFIIKYSPSFVAMNPFRDNWRTLHNLPAVIDKYGDGNKRGVRRAYLKEYFNSWNDAWRYYKGDVTPEVRFMLDSFAIASPLSGMFTLAGHSTTPSILFALAGEAPPSVLTKPMDWFTHLLKVNTKSGTVYPIAQAGEAIRRRMPKQMKWVNPMTYLSFIPAIGAVSEVMPKIAAFRVLQGRMSQENIAHVLRDYIGTPNYRRRGAWTGITNAFYPFSNIILQGYSADAKLAFDKRSAGSYWLTFAMVNGGALAFYAAMKSGLLGEELEEWADHVGTYDKQNYFVGPVGMVPGGMTSGKKAVVFRMPMNESTAIPHGLAMIAIDMAIAKWKDTPEGQQALKEWASRSSEHLFSVLPSKNNIFEIIGAGMAWMQNKQMTDSFTGQGIFSRDALSLGHEYTIKELGQYFLEKTGFTNLVPYNFFEPGKNLNKEAIEFIPALSSFLKYTDAGIRMRDYVEQELESGHRAWARTQLPPLMRDLRLMYYRLQRQGADDRNPLEQAQYEVLRKHMRVVEDDIDSIASLLEDNPKRLSDKQWVKFVREKMRGKYEVAAPLIQQELKETVDRLTRQ